MEKRIAAVIREAETGFVKSACALIGSRLHPHHSSVRRKIPIIAAVCFIAVFIAIIGIANRGEGNNWWAFLNHVPHGDKLGHVGLVGTLSLLCNLAFRPRRAWKLPRAITLTTFILLVLLTLEEIAQALLPHRTCDLFDWLADLVGLAVGKFIAGKIRWVFHH
jgi:hypothetical protein